MDWHKLHLERLVPLLHLEEVRAVADDARQWHELKARLQAKGWRNITPATVAALCPNLPRCGERTREYHASEEGQRC